MKEKETVLFWPEHKVYLYGQVSFLRQQIDNIGLRRQKISKYFQPLDGEDLFEDEISRYRKEGYFKTSESVDGDGKKLYFLTDIDQSKFKDELMGYLLEVQDHLVSDEADKILQSAIRQKNEHGYSPTITWQDIYGDTARYNYHPPFWEHLFLLASEQKIRLTAINYTSVLPYLLKKDGLKPMPKEMLDFYVRPRAELTLIDPDMMKRVLHPRGIVRTRITLNLVGKSLWGHIGNNRYLLWRYQSKTSNNFLALESLINKPDEFLTRDSLNLKTDAKTQLKHLPANMGFTGILNDLFLKKIDNPKSALRLSKAIFVENAELKLLKTEFEKRDKNNRE
jgi:hypothetical protein